MPRIFSEGSLLGRKSVTNFNIISRGVSGIYTLSTSFIRWGTTTPQQTIVSFLGPRLLKGKVSKK